MDSSSFQNLPERSLPEGLEGLKPTPLASHRALLPLQAIENAGVRGPEEDGGRGDEGDKHAEAAAKSLSVIASHDGLAESLLANGSALQESVRVLRYVLKPSDCHAHSRFVAML